MFCSKRTEHAHTQLNYLKAQYYDFSEAYLHQRGTFCCQLYQIHQ